MRPQRRRVGWVTLVATIAAVGIALAAVAGLTNATAFGEEWEDFKTYVEPRPEAVSDVAAALGWLRSQAPASRRATFSTHTSWAMAMKLPKVGCRSSRCVRSGRK